MSIVEPLNKIFDNKIVGNSALIITGVLAGYCLQPVPKVFHDAFDSSNVLKFFVLFILSIVGSRPETDKQLAINAIIILVLLALVETYREVKSTKVEVKRFDGD